MVFSAGTCGYESIEQCTHTGSSVAEGGRDACGAGDGREKEEGHLDDRMSREAGLSHISG